MINKVELWKGWYFYNNIIYDNAGNRYSEKDVKYSWLADEIINDHLSKPTNIKIMHSELRKKEVMISQLPTLCLIWESKKEGIIEKIYQLTEK